MHKTLNNKALSRALMLVIFICALFFMLMVQAQNAYAAPADGATVQHGGVLGTSTVTWEVYSDGSLILRPTSGDEGQFTSTRAYPWDTYREDITRVEVLGTVHAAGNLQNMFLSLTNVTEMDLSGLDTSNVMDMSRMFAACRGLTSLDVSGFDTSNVTNMYSMFYGCSGLTSLDVSGFDTSNVTNMASMFNDCRGLTSLDVSGFDTSNVTNINSMFANCNELTSLDVSGFDTSNVTNMLSMFAACRGLTSLDVSGFDTSNVTDMYSMFNGCSGLTSLDVSGFDTSNVTDMYCMFNGCSKLSEIVLGDQFSFKGENITSTDQMAVLPTPSGSGYTGKWIKEDETAGPLTAEEIRDQYGDNAGLWAGTWIWEETPTSYTLIFTAPAEVSGSMTKQKIVAAEDGTIKPNAFVLFNYHFDHWDASDGNTYEDQALIPANTYNIGDEITLTAVFEKNDNSVNMEDGTFDLILHGDEKAIFDEIPAGTAYQVWEETPDGWVLLEQRDASGTIQPLQTADAYFLNKYQPGTTTATFVGSKIIDGRAAPAGAYTFELLEDGNVIQTKQNVEGGFIAFDTITYTAAGEHEYKVREVPGNDDAIDYDRHVETINVSVVDNNGELSSTVTYDSDGINFVNRTKPGTIEIIKEVEGQTDANKDSIFTFKVILQNENGTLVTGNNYYWYTEDIAG